MDRDDPLTAAGLEPLVVGSLDRLGRDDEAQGAVDYPDILRVHLADLVESHAREQADQRYPEASPPGTGVSRLGVAVVVVLAAGVERGGEDALKLLRGERLPLVLAVGGVYDTKPLRGIPVDEPLVDRPGQEGGQLRHIAVHGCGAETGRLTGVPCRLGDLAGGQVRVPLG